MTLGVRFVVIASLSTMGLVGVFVGLRLLLLARHTRQLPETLMGIGLMIMAVLGGPLASAARMPGLVGTELGDKLFAVGIGLVQLGIACFYAFTWQVFRKHSTAALLFLVLVCVACGAVGHGLVAASIGDTMDAIYLNTRPWAMAVVGLVGVAFVWTAFEALAYHRKLSRRLALGLAEPEVANRFWLWGVGALGTSSLCGVMLVPMSQGIPPLQSPTILAIMGFASAVNSTCWFFAFFPPRAYLAHVRARSATAVAASG